MPTISSNKQYSVSKNLRLYLLSQSNKNYSIPGTGGSAADYHLTGDIADIANLPLAATSATNIRAVYYFNKIPNLQEIPDLVSEGNSGDIDTIEITTLEDAYHEYADGLKTHTTEGGDSINFTFLFDSGCFNALTVEVDRIKALLNTYGENESVANWQAAYVVLPDDSYFAMNFKDLSTTFKGAGTNAALTYELNVSLNSGAKFAPASTSATAMFAKAGILDGDSDHYKRLTSTTSSAVLTPEVVS